MITALLNIFMGLVLTEILSFLKTREKPQGGGAFFFAWLIWNRWKKPPPPLGLFTKNPGIVLHKFL